MFTAYDFGWMINDRTRTNAYIEALRAADVRGKVVLDIGTGSGFFALLACRFGAQKVYAFEPDSIIDVARACAVENNLSDRIEFFQAMSTRVTLPEKADVIISDLRGILPLFQQHLPSIIDARERHLAPDGIMIPQKDSLWTAVVELPDLYQNYAPSWVNEEYDLDMSAARRHALNTTTRISAKADDLLLPPQRWSILDYTRLTGPDIGGQVHWQVAQPGLAHGMVVWFDCLLLNEIGFSNAPGQPELIYRQLFFPFSEAIELVPGYEVTISIQARLIENEYVWRWDTLVRDQKSGAEAKINLKQSSFYSVPLSTALLRKKAAGFIPSLKMEGQIDRFALNLMENNLSLAEIAGQLVDEFPDQFDDWERALARAGKLSQKYSR